MSHSREDLAGVCLAEEYTLRRYLVSEDSGDFFEAARDTGEPVLIRLEPDGDSADDRLALWRRTAYLQHPNLLRLLDCGRSEQAIYAVMESPDDHLTAGLQHGPLAEPETRDLLLALLDALRYLHAQGLVHGQVDANHVWAVGDTIKLSTDDLREPMAGESPYAGDIGALGALLYLALTGRQFEKLVRDVPEPFATIVRNTAGAEPADRWRIPEILAALPPLPKQPAPVPELPPVAVPVAVVEEQVPPPPVQPQIIGPPQRLAQPRLPVWAWPASLAVVLGCIAWVLHTPQPKVAPKAAPKPPAPVYAPAPQNTTPVVPPPPQPVESASTEAQREAPAPQGRTVWRVIAYTYNAFRDAERKALAINRRWPGFNAEVFAPKGKTNPPYLVALGGRMNRMDATKLLQKARSSGLPRDTFILNFSD